MRYMNDSKICTKCKIEKSIDNFNTNNRRPDKLNLWCQQCVSNSVRKWRGKNKDYVKKKAAQYLQENYDYIYQRTQKYKQSVRGKLKREMVLQAGGKCVLCGYNKCMKALDFHHKDPCKKDGDISFLLRTRTYADEKLLKEISKCVLLCCRCHREIHAGISKLPDEPSSGEYF